MGDLSFPRFGNFLANFINLVLSGAVVGLNDFSGIDLRVVCPCLRDFSLKYCMKVSEVTILAISCRDLIFLVSEIRFPTRG